MILWSGLATTTPRWGAGPNRTPWQARSLNPSTVNRYVYVRDDPVNFVDPTGRVGYLGACAVGAGTGVAATYGAAIVTAVGSGGTLALPSAGVVGASAAVGCGVGLVSQGPTDVADFLGI